MLTSSRILKGYAMMPSALETCMKGPHIESQAASGIKKALRRTYGELMNTGEMVQT